MLCVNKLKVMYRIEGFILRVSMFDSAEYDVSASTITFSSIRSDDLIFTIPHASAILAMNKLLADGYCDLQSFDCRFSD